MARVAMDTHAIRARTSHVPCSCASDPLSALGRLTVLVRRWCRLISLLLSGYFVEVSKITPAAGLLFLPQGATSAARFERRTSSVLRVVATAVAPKTARPAWVSQGS